ncbi:hypothetical protein BACINT_00558 [Bacteroides intestinalis DSM 17393]|uniref:Uncharacterized protein n=1 Tax=Bacteroides intestinalis DSM 17393 TaxID=471870 RepID=B3C6M2_9BACE|nr:hypothetical protein BACINT_00558 [Bacteroides intestinalis DSM 17393]
MLLSLSENTKVSDFIGKEQIVLSKSIAKYRGFLSERCRNRSVVKIVNKIRLINYCINKE